MTKLDWEKQNQTQLIVKRLNQCLNKQIADTSKDAALLNSVGYPAPLEGLDVVRTSRSQWIRETQDLQRKIDRYSKLDGNERAHLKKFVEKELRDVFTQLATIRLISTYPFELSKKIAANNSRRGNK